MGIDIELAQRVLHALGYDIGPIDGVIGSKTRMVLVEFQNRVGISATGKVDNKTYERIKKVRDLIETCTEDSIDHVKHESVRVQCGEDISSYLSQ